MLTCYDVSAIMSAMNLVQIRIILMNALKATELILAYGHLQTFLLPIAHLLFAIVSAESLSIQYKSDDSLN